MDDPIVTYLARTLFVEDDISVTYPAIKPRSFDPVDTYPARTLNTGG